MKTNTQQINREQKMKSTKNDSQSASDPSALQASNSNWDQRFQTLCDLAHDGDEIAAAELELMFA